MTVVASAGNEAIDASEFTPAGFEDVIAVSALVDYDGAPGGLGTTPPCWKQTFAAEVDDSFAFFSNYGSVIDLIAPGVCVLTTTQAGQYALVSGTSFSAPHATGGAALYLADHPGASPSRVRAALMRAGSVAWDASDDPDGIQEPLLDVSTL